MGTRRAVGLILAAALALAGCRGGAAEGWSRKGRTMALTSGPTEVVISSSRVPGYWADQLGQEFFLYTRDRSFKKGDQVKVEGPYGGASVTLFRDDARTYFRGSPVPLLVLVVWKIESSEDGPRP